MISLSGVTKRYGAATAVQDLSFTVNSGETLGLLGQNGAGKTTTLNIITGYLAPTSGDVRVGDYDLLTQPRQAKRLIGYLPEQERCLRTLDVDRCRSSRRYMMK